MKTYQLGQMVLAGIKKRKGVIVTDEMTLDGHKGHYVCFFNNFDDSWGPNKIESPIWWTLTELTPISGQ